MLKFFPLSLLCFLACILGCDKPSPDPCEHCTPVKDTLALEVLWNVPMADDTAWRDGERPFIFQGRVLFNERDLDESIDHVHVFDKLTGNRLWKWRPNPSRGTISSASGIYQKNNLVTFTMWREVYCADMATLMPRWETKVLESEGIGSPHIGVFGDCVYHEHSKSAIKDTFAHLVRANLNVGKWDTVFSLINTDRFTPNLCSVAGFKHPNGDSILFFQDRSYNFPERIGRTSLYAYNLNADTLLWKRVGFGGEVNSNVIQPPLVYNNHLFFLGAKHLYAIDVFTGDIDWKRHVEDWDNTIVASINISEGKLFFKSVEDTNLYALDPKTGNILWISTNLGSSTPYITYRNGVIYFAAKDSGKIYAVRAADGKKILEIKSPNYAARGKSNGNAFFQFLEVDQETGYLYASDGHFFICMKPKF